MIMIVKTPGSQMGSPAAAEEGGEDMGGEKCESGERSEVQVRSTVASTVSKAFRRTFVTSSSRRTSVIGFVRLGSIFRSVLLGM